MHTMTLGNCTGLLVVKVSRHRLIQMLLVLKWVSFQWDW